MPRLEPFGATPHARTSVSSRSRRPPSSVLMACSSDCVASDHRSAYTSTNVRHESQVARVGAGAGAGAGAGVAGDDGAGCAACAAAGVACDACSRVLAGAVPDVDGVAAESAERLPEASLLAVLPLTESRCSCSALE